VGGRGDGLAVVVDDFCGEYDERMIANWAAVGILFAKRAGGGQGGNRV
jgi:hypothetical protein